MKSIDVMLDIWKWAGCVFVGGTSAEFATLAKNSFNADIHTGTNATAHAYVAYGLPWLIWVNSLHNVPALAHEALHIASGILEHRGLKHTAESEEAYTYTMEHIIRQTLTAKRWRIVRP